VDVRLLGFRIRIPPGNECRSSTNVACFLVEVYATARSLIQRSPTDFVVSLCVIQRNSNPPHLSSGQVDEVGLRKYILLSGALTFAPTYSLT
jgi:hypothetical protein